MAGRRGCTFFWMPCAHQLQPLVSRNNEDNRERQRERTGLPTEATHHFRPVLDSISGSTGEISLLILLQFPWITPLGHELPKIEQSLVPQAPDIREN